MKDLVNVRIPASIAQVIEAHLKDLGANSVEEYVAAVLGERLRQLGYLSAYSPEDEKEIEKRLRDLGYLE